MRSAALPPLSKNPQLNLERSLRYYQKSLLNPDAWFSVVEGDYRMLLEAIDWESLFPTRTGHYSLLDVGCGTGRFPSLLSSHLSPSLRIYYDVCDPSQYCLTACQQALHPPLFPGRAWNTTLEYAEDMWIPGSYDVAWAIQSFYCLNHETLYESIGRFLSAIHPIRGTAGIVLAKREAFFSQVQRFFFQEFPLAAPPPYVSAESVATTLERLEANTVIRELEIIHTISIWEDRLLEQYLQQCVLDATPLPKWKASANFRTFLDTFRHGDVYQFPNPSWLLLTAPKAAGTEGKNRLQNYLKTVSPTRLAS